MGYCSSCGFNIDEQWSFCPNCGLSKDPEKKSNKLIDQGRDQSIYAVLTIIGLAFILFAIDRGADWLDVADAADDCADSQDELENVLGAEASSNLCKGVKGEASELLLETFILLIIGLYIVFVSTNNMNEEGKGGGIEKQRIEQERGGINNAVQSSTRSDLRRCRYFFNEDEDSKHARCSNYHLNEMYCDEHARLIESRTENKSE